MKLHCMRGQGNKFDPDVSPYETPGTTRHGVDIEQGKNGLTYRYQLGNNPTDTAYRGPRTKQEVIHRMITKEKD